jgi:hypothetical protein
LADGNAVVAHHLYQERYPGHKNVQLGKHFWRSTAVSVNMGILNLVLLTGMTKIYNFWFRGGCSGYCGWNSWNQ